MEKENSGMDISVGEKVISESSDCNNEVTSKAVDVNGETSEALDDNDAAAGEPSLEAKGEVAKKKKNKSNRKKKEPLKQTDPPTIPVVDLFPSGDFPDGEIQQYKDDNLWRVTSEETRELDRLQKPIYNSVRRAAEVHLHVRKYIRTIVKPGMLMTDLCETLDNTVHKLISENGLQDGIAFPTGFSLNSVAAHWTPNSGDKTVLDYNDVMKLDFGTNIDGHLVDCALTVAFNPMFDPLLEASREATNTGIREVGIDVRLCDVGAAIQEVMESYEVEINGKLYQDNQFGFMHRRSTMEAIILIRQLMERYRDPTFAIMGTIYAFLPLDQWILVTTPEEYEDDEKKGNQVQMSSSQNV